jgi:hypothetical protein
MQDLERWYKYYTNNIQILLVKENHSGQLKKFSKNFDKITLFLVRFVHELNFKN